jgi:hypothetical protein
MKVTDKTTGNKRIITIELDDESKFENRDLLVKKLKYLSELENIKNNTDYSNQFSCSKILDIINDSYYKEKHKDCDELFLMAGKFSKIISALSGDLVGYNSTDKKFIVTSPSELTLSCIEFFNVRANHWSICCPRITVEQVIELVNQHVNDDLDYFSLKHYIFNDSTR